MDIKLIAQVACSILAVLATHGTCQGECEFRFHQQPRSNLTCNPHQGTTTLHLTCFARGPLKSWFQISWWSSKLPTTEHSTLQPPPHRVGDQEYQVTETRANNSQSTLISSTLSLTVQEIRGGTGGVCVWCEIDAPGRNLVSPTSSRLCVRERGAYSSLRDCKSQEVVPHSFERVCISELSPVIPESILNDTGFFTSRVSHVEYQEHLYKTSMPTGSTSLPLLEPEPTVPASPSKTPGPLPNIYPSTDTPTALIDTGGGSSGSMSLPISPGLFPTPTMLGDGDEGREKQPGSLLSSESLTALYAAVVVCVLLAAIVVVLVVIVLVMCRRHSKLQRRTNRAVAKSGSPSRLGPNNTSRAGHFRSQLSFSGSETAETKRDLAAGAGGGRGLPLVGLQDTRFGSEQEARKGSLDRRSSVGSRSVSTEKSNSLPRKNSLQHKYAEIETVSHGEISHSAPHHNGGTGFLHQQMIGSRNGSIPSKMIPPPPNTRARSSSTPHFYYILEKLDGGEGRGEEESRLKYPWEVGAPSQIKSRSREGSTKNRAGSLKREVGGAVRTELSGGNQSEFCWGDGTMRSRSGSCPGREKKGGSTKRLVVSREGSSKSTKSRSGSGKRATSVEGNGKVVTESREGSVKSRGSRDGSCKKEVWVPAHDPLQSNTKTGEKRVPPPYDALEPKFGSYPSPFSIINESYFAITGGDDPRDVLFDDPKYAAVSVGDLPQLVDQQRHRSLDPIVPHRSYRYQPGQSDGTHQKAACRGRGRGGGVGRVKAASSKSLQDSGVLGGGGEGGGVRDSIYQTRDSTPVRGIGMSVGGNTPSRLSMPFDSYYS